VSALFVTGFCPHAASKAPQKIMVHNNTSIFAKIVVFFMQTPLLHNPLYNTIVVLSILPVILTESSKK
jgi:hypothetical protein